MAINPNLVSVGSLQEQTSAQNAINTNFSKISTALQDALARDGASPNEMEAALDMNSNRIVNLPEPISPNEPLRLKDLEDFVGTGLTVSPLPTGGTTGQLLRKNSNANYDTVWANEAVPAGGAVNQYLTKNSTTDYDLKWSYPIPTGGATGQVLSKVNGTDYNTQWTTPASATSTTYNVKDYGALGNYNVSMVNMAIGSSTITGGTSGFTMADVGKYISVTGAGSAGAALYTTIAGYISATSVVLTAPNASGNTITGALAEYGTDDAPAFQAAWNACKAAGGGIVSIPKGAYFLSQLNMTNTSVRMTLRGSGINCSQIFPMQVAAYGTTAGHMFDMTGSSFLMIEDMQIGAYYTQAIPATCIFMAQVPSGSSNRNGLSKVYISGQFSGATFYNYGVPSLWTISDCDFYNYRKGAGTQNCMTLTYSNMYNYVSNYTTVATGTWNTSDISFVQCEWHKFADAGADNSVMILQGASNITFLSGVISGGATAYVFFYGPCGKISFLNVTFETESQPVIPLYAFYLNVGTSSTGVWDDGCLFITTIGKYSTATTSNNQTYATF